MNHGCAWIYDSQCARGGETSRLRLFNTWERQVLNTGVGRVELRSGAAHVQHLRQRVYESSGEIQRFNIFII